MKRILVATDLSSRSELAVMRAAALAKARNAELTVAERARRRPAAGADRAATAGHRQPAGSERTGPEGAPRRRVQGDRAGRRSGGGDQRGGRGDRRRPAGDGRAPAHAAARSVHRHHPGAGGTQCEDPGAARGRCAGRGVPPGAAGAGLLADLDARGADGRPARLPRRRQPHRAACLRAVRQGHDALFGDQGRPRRALRRPGGTQGQRRAARLRRRPGAGPRGHPVARRRRLADQRDHDRGTPPGAAVDGARHPGPDRLPPRADRQRGRGGPRRPAM
ncbi:universal stress protein [Pseudomonas aeruginosa]|nr:universal stress protein [Pseudomonas aeruginosa]